MRFALAFALAAVASGCARNPSILLDSAGPHAAAIAWLFWIFLAVSAVVWLLVIAALLFALLRPAPAGPDVPRLAPPARRERRLLRIVAACVGATVVVLTGFVGLSFAVDRQLIALDREVDLVIRVTAHQWWWEVRYENDVPGLVFATANEIHVPVGRSVRLDLGSRDVIHSVWFPNLAGKRDVIPGRDQSLTLRADKEGVWRGRCAEFCGNQHAFMGLTLVAEPEQDFSRWQEAQRAPAASPSTAVEARGMRVFLDGSCAMCHVIRGTPATGAGGIAPDLTHLKSRDTIGAGVAPNRKGYLGGWILDPHGLKPGVHMPPVPQDSADFQALLAYLESLT